MELLDAIYHRRAVREFLDEAIPRDSILKLIDAAIQAPSAMNLQPWSFAVVEDRAALKKISDRAKAHLLETIPPDSPLARMHDELANPNFDIFYRAPLLIVICVRSGASTADFEAGDCALAAENLMLAAHGMGFGTCWIGLSAAWLNTSKGKSELGIPAGYRAVAPIIVGKPKSFPPSHGRQPPEIFWHPKKS